MRRISLAAICLSILFTQTGCQSTQQSAPAPVTIKVIALNDFHGHLNPPRTLTRIPDAQSPGKFLELPTGGAEYMGSLIAQAQARNELNVVVAAGDLISGAPLVSALFHQEPAIEALSRMGLEIAAVGNHEFDAGTVELLRMQNGGCFPGDGRDTCRNGRFAGAQFRYLAANVIDRTTRKPLFPAYTVKLFQARNGPVPVAFIGLVTKDTTNLVIPSGIAGVEFADEADTANALIPELRSRGIASIVVLIHEGGETTQKSFDDQTCPGFTGRILSVVERMDPAIDLVVSGHTHKTYICRHAGRLITSAGSEGRFITDIDLTIDPATKDVTNAVARQFAAVNDTAPNPLPDRYPTMPKDSRLTPLVNLYNEQAAPFSQREVCKIAADITRTRNAAGESSMGDLVSDAQLAATRRPDKGGAQVAFMNQGGMRADLRADRGVVTYGDIFSVHPFGNGLVTMTLTGQQIHELLELQWSAANSMLQPSDGFTYAWDGRKPLGQRVVVDSIRLNDAPLDPQGKYRVTVNEFLAAGGDGFAVLKSGTDRLRGVIDVDALEGFVSGRSAPLAPSRAERIRRLDAPVAGQH